MAYRRDRRDRRGIFKGLDIFIHRGARHKEQFFSDIKALTENGAALVHHPITFLAPILIIVEVSTSTRVKDFVYKINSVPAGQSRVREEGEVTDWNLDQVMGYFSQAPREIPVLQHHWIKDCLEHRRILGKADNWGGWHVNNLKFREECLLTVPSASGRSPKLEERNEIKDESVTSTRDSTAPCDVEVEDNSLFGSPDSPSIKAETPFSNLDQASVALEEGLSFLSVTSNIEKSHTQPYSVPQIFVLGPNRMLFHVMDSPGRAFLQAAITAGGGSMMELCWATYVIVAPGTTAESMMTFASDKSICARLVRSHWITDSMVAAKLLDPGPYEVSHEDQAKLLGDEVQC
ncbi:hypothetical protein CcaverHIS002_0307340 [Cutaneotrichosporon cavernicola]|uniref:BRCT domain-containing protein n=1 Tax=Cutaneotrichosporon cavernicola TaxID=279322 RepID=A0AA48IA39_9TREE|nr:uncharacterized protein CcaverHIS019_0307250 [Cutaneotrichosporon cavernicola]BEI82866.1 hypothetical protein CcaverHIS002_0307340 [Cutaneotrichosporon cavernicola]BEI90655.1 hypothetical protein CcaverHIS019_0307250 [Cutaneotrichosporon cavernicola]BEI98433.1 hypothetical protein CcaverHIS631_0307320 [Cutaneotrichosporon cavernicola]